MDYHDNFKELEFKYKSNIGLSKFIQLVESFSPVNFLQVSSYDTYYIDKEGTPGRFRNSPSKPEFTIKRKNSPLNNQSRYELNLPLAVGVKEEIVDEFAKDRGFAKNFKIFKSCWIYFFKEVDLVFYSVYDEDLNEIGRFIEIELLENNKLTEEAAFDILKLYESKLGVLGITPQHRLKKSLFEIYKK